MCKYANEYKWSSAKYHTGLLKKDPLIKSRYEGISSAKEWKKILKSEHEAINSMKIHFRTGRPIGSLHTDKL